MITIIIKNAQDYDTILTKGYHVVKPTFIEFLNALSIAIGKGHETLYVYDTGGQFATMPRWAMCEKIGELTPYESAMSGSDIILYERDLRGF